MKKIYMFSLISIVLIVGCESSNLVDPKTVIQYSIAENAHVKVEIENSYNTLITILVDEEQYAGYYQVEFATSNLAEGVYFYTIEAKGVNNNYYLKETKSLFLVK